MTTARTGIAALAISSLALSVGIPAAISTVSAADNITVPCLPMTLSVASTDRHVFIACSEGGVRVVNLVTGKSSAAAGGDALVTGLATSPTQALAYASVPGPNTILSITSSGTATTIATLGLSDSPAGIAVNPQGTQLYVGVDAAPDRLAILAAPSGTVTGSVPLSGRPMLVAADPDSTTAWTVVDKAGVYRLVKVSASAEKVVGTSKPLPTSRPVDLVIDPRGRVALVLHESGVITQVDLADLSVSTVATLAEGTWSGLVISPDGAWAYASAAALTSTGRPTIRRIDVRSGASTAVGSYDGLLPDLAQLTDGSALIAPLVEVDSHLESIDVTAAVVTGITPAIGPRQGGQRFIISGDNFVGSVSVRIAGVPCTIIDSDSFAVTCVTEATKAAAGAGDVSVTTAQGRTLVSGLVTLVDPPVITDVTPRRAAVTQSTSITIAGRNLAGPGTTKIQIGSLPCRITSLSATAVTCRVTPDRVLELRDVTVTTPGGEDSLTRVFRFVAPTIGDVSPRSVSTYGGEELRIGGDDLIEVKKVTIAGKECPIDVADAVRTFIQCTVPNLGPAAAGEQVVRVSTAYGEDVFTITVRALPVPPASKADAFTSADRLIVFFDGSSLETARLSGYEIQMQTRGVIGQLSEWRTVRTTTGARTAITFKPKDLELGRGDVVRFRVATVNSESRRSSWTEPSPWRELTNDLPAPTGFQAVYDESSDVAALTWIRPQATSTGALNVRGYELAYQLPDTTEWQTIDRPILGDANFARMSLKQVPKGTLKFRIRSIGWPGDILSDWTVDKSVRK